MRSNQHVEALRQTLTWLRVNEAGGAIETLVGHSMGGIAIQDLQAEALGSGTTVRSQFGVTAVLLLASTMPEERSWSYADATPFEVLADLLPNLCTNTTPHCAQPIRPGGLYAEVKPDIGRRIFFNACGTASLPAACGDGRPLPPVADIPSDLELDAITSPEGVFVALDVLGLFGGSRPSVPASAFDSSKGTLVRVVAFEHDYFLDVAEEHALASWLRPGTGANVIAGSRAQHDLPWSGPELLAGDLAAVL